MAPVLSEEQIEIRLQKIKSSEPDQKVDTLTFLGIQFENYATDKQELPRSILPAITLLLPPLIRHPHPLLHTTCLSSFIPDYIPLIPLHPQDDLRLALISLMPAILERVHDSKPRIHDPAENCLIKLGDRCLESDEGLTGGSNSGGLHPSGSGSSLSTSSGHVNTNGKGKEKETISQGFERMLRDSLQAKGVRNKLGAMKVLLGVREKHHHLPLKPWLPLLVDALLDGDGSVRESAKDALIKLLSPTFVPAAARSELRKLFTAKSVKPSIADSILQRIIEGPVAVPVEAALTNGGSLPAGVGSESSSTGAGEGDVVAVYLATDKDVEKEFAVMRPWFEGAESEQNWKEREKMVMRVRGMLKGGTHKRLPDAFMHGLKNGFLMDCQKAVESLRTSLSSLGAVLYMELANDLGKALDSVAESMLAPLAKVTGANKPLFVNKVFQAIQALITHTSYHRFLLPFILTGLTAKIPQTRVHFSKHLQTFMNVHAVAHRVAIEHADGLSILVAAVKKALADTHPSVKEPARQAYFTFCTFWPKEGAAILESLDPASRAQVEKSRLAGNPKAAAVSALAQPKRTSSAMSTAELLRQKKMEAKSRMRVVSAAAPASLQTPDPSPKPVPRRSLQTGSASPPSKEDMLEKVEALRSSQTAALDSLDPPPIHRAHTESAAVIPVLETVPPPTIPTPAFVSAPLPLVEPPIATPTPPIDVPRPPVLDHRPTASTGSTRMLSSPQSSTSRSLPDSPPPDALIETLDSIDCSFWSDRLPVDLEAKPPVPNENEKSAWLNALRAKTISIAQLERLSRFTSSGLPACDSSPTALEIRQLIKSSKKSEDGKLEAFLEDVVDALLFWLRPELDEELLEEGLFILWDLALRRNDLISDREAATYEAIFSLRRCDDSTIRRSSAALAALLPESTQDPVLQLNVVVAILQRSSEISKDNQKYKERVVILGLITIARLMLKLPGAVVEDETRRISGFIMSGMNSQAIACREASATLILSIQYSLRDESLLFGLLPELTPAQRNLLTYMFERHRFRKGEKSSSTSTVVAGKNNEGSGEQGMLVREMRRLSTKM